MEYLDFFKELNEKGIEYIIVGGLALIIHGSPRFTYDIDVVLSLEDDNIYKFINILIEAGYKAKVPVNPIDFADKRNREEWINNKNMKAFNFYNENSSLPEIDIVIFGVDYKELKDNAKEFEIDDVKLSVASIKDLIKMKNNAARKVDLEDIEYLKIIEVNNV